MFVPRTEHTADRPSWDCRVCTQPWPCANAKIDLRDEYQNSRGVGLFMALCMSEAIESFSGMTGRIPADLFDRFLGWVSATGMPPDVTGTVEQTAVDGESAQVDDQMMQAQPRPRSD
jgi:hypothetical protein